VKVLRKDGVKVMKILGKTVRRTRMKPEYGQKAVIHCLSKKYIHPFSRGLGAGILREMRNSAPSRNKVLVLFSAYFIVMYLNVFYA